MTQHPVKDNNINILLDCTDYLLVELLKLEETTAEETQEFAKLMYEDHKLEEAISRPITKKMWSFLNYLAIYKVYLFFSKQFVEGGGEEKFKLYLDSDLETILLKNNLTGDIISDKEYIKNVIYTDYTNKTLNMIIDTNSFRVKTDLISTKSVRKFILEYLNLDIKVNDDICIVFSSNDIYHGKEKKQWELYKKITENIKKINEEIQNKL